MKISNIEESTFNFESLFWTFEGVIITLEDGTTFKIGMFTAA